MNVLLWDSDTGLKYSEVARTVVPCFDCLWPWGHEDMSRLRWLRQALYLSIPCCWACKERKKERNRKKIKKERKPLLLLSYAIQCHICVWACVYIHKALQTLSLVLNSQTEGCLDLYKQLADMWTESISTHSGCKGQAPRHWTYYTPLSVIQSVIFTLKCSHVF